MYISVYLYSSLKLLNVECLSDVFSLPEPYYARIIELLHVPLQTLYRHSQKNGENGQIRV